jgi:hypothetical protein
LVADDPVVILLHPAATALCVPCQIAAGLRLLTEFLSQLRIDARKINVP